MAFDRHHSASDLEAHGLRVAVAVSEYHAALTHAMRDAAVECFLRAGGSQSNLQVVAAPGSFELVAICRALAAQRQFDAIVAIGCIIAGETTHDRHLASGVVAGLTQITVGTGVPIAMGVLTCQTMAQARARAGGAVGNKGHEAMAAAIHVAQTLRGIATAPLMERS
jgi:6,7-dimethyl-8-ribityllumazine synthase